MFPLLPQPQLLQRKTMRSTGRGSRGRRKKRLRRSENKGGDSSSSNSFSSRAINKIIRRTRPTTPRPSASGIPRMTTRMSMTASTTRIRSIGRQREMEEEEEEEGEADYSTGQLRAATPGCCWPPCCCCWMESSLTCPWQAGTHRVVFDWWRCII